MQPVQNKDREPIK